MVFASLAARCKTRSPAKQFDVQQKCWEAVNEAYRDELLQRWTSDTSYSCVHKLCYLFTSFLLLYVYHGVSFCILN